MFGHGNPIKVIAVDCGIKHNMIRTLIKVRLLLTLSKIRL